MNRNEMEINEIRLKLHEETKDMTMTEQIRKVNELGNEVVVQYGLKIGKPQSNTKKVI